MALMRTINPVFVSFKRWVAENAQNRPELKVPGDVRQVDIVEVLLQAQVPAAALVPEAGMPNIGAAL